MSEFLARLHNAVRMAEFSQGPSTSGKKFTCIILMGEDVYDSYLHECERHYRERGKPEIPRNGVKFQGHRICRDLSIPDDTLEVYVKAYP